MPGKKASLAALGALFLLAALLRLYSLGTIPPGLHGDEAWTGLDARRILAEGWIGPYVGSALGQPTGPLYWTAFIFKLLGQSIFTLRLAMALLGLLTLPLIYILYRTLFNARVALFGTGLLALSYWHIFFSRTGFMLISLPLVEAASLYLLFRGFQSGRWRHFMGAGILLGLGIYSYNTYPFFILGLALFLGLKLAAERGRLKRNVAALALAAALALLVAAPFLKYVIQTWPAYTDHLSVVSVFKESEYTELASWPAKALFFLKHAFQPLITLTLYNSIDYSDGLGGRPLLDPLTAAFFLGGIALSLRRWRDQRSWLIILGLASGMAAVVLTASWGHNRRGIGGLPFILLAAALGMDLAWVYLRRLRPPWGRWLPYAFLALALGFITFYNLNYYYKDWRGQAEAKWVYAYDLAQLSRRLEDMEPRPYVYFYSGRWSYGYETRRFLAPHVPGEDRSREFGRFSLERDREGKVAYVFMPPYEYLGKEIEDAIPGGEFREFRDEGSRFMFSIYLIPGE